MAETISHEAPAREVRSLPVMVPAKLIGRDTDLAEIYSHLKDNETVHLYGMAGIGKTALAATLASAYTQQPGGVLWMNVDLASLEDLYVRVGRAYQVNEITRSNNPISTLGAVTRTLAQHKPLVVLDGKIDYSVAAEFVSKAATGLPVLIVNRDQMMDDTWHTVELERLRAQHSTELLSYASGSPADPDIEALAEELDDIPFALVVAAGTIRANQITPGAFLNTLKALPPGTNSSPQIAALTAGFRSLNSAFQGIILMMGATFGGQASAEMLSMISGVAPDAAQKVMNALTARFMAERIQRYGQPYYQLHEITYGFAQSFLRASGKLEGLQSKIRDSVLAYAQKYSKNDAESFDRLATEMESILRVAKWAGDDGNHDIPQQLVTALTQAGDFVNSRGYVPELLRLQKLSSSYTTAFPAYPAAQSLWRDVDENEGDDEDFIDEDEELLDDEDELFEDDLDEDEDDGPGVLDFLEDVVEDSQAVELAAPKPDVLESDDLTALRTALAEAKGKGNKERQVALLRKIGELQVQQSMDIEAIASYNEALNVYEELDDDEGTLEMLDTLSTLMAKTENSQAAVLHATRGIRLADELDERQTWMHLLITLGDARQQLGESAEAIRSYEQALEFVRKNDDSTHEAIILYKLGYAQLDEGEGDTAIQTWEQALALFKKQLKRSYEGRVMGGLGTAYGEEERWSEAMSFYTSALHIAREVSDQEEEALQLGNLAYAAVQADQLGQAVLRYRQALHLAYQRNNREDIVSTVVDLVRLLLQSRRHVSVGELLVNDALTLEPNDRDLIKLKERIATEKAEAETEGVQLISVSGTAQEYAANAYKLLEE